MTSLIGYYKSCCNEYWGTCIFFKLSCISCLNILQIKSLSAISFANIVSHSEGCFVILFIAFMLGKRKVFKFNLVSFVYFCYFIIFITLGGGTKRYCCNFLQRGFCLCFPLSFIVSDFTFRSIVHYEFFCVYIVMWFCNFIISYVAVQFSQHHVLKKLVFSTL